MKRALLILIALAIAVPYPQAAGGEPPRPGPKDKCPVCGMFVAKYPDFLAVIVFKNGAVAYFDGVKDMMKYRLNLLKYAPQEPPADILAIHVTDYYRMEFIDGSKAFYAAGSDVYGPMGKELIPFEKEAEAGEFVKDHKGKSVLTFDQVNMEVVRGLD
jgi:copper chaperone NosL